jgi:hypothetical protein
MVRWGLLSVSYSSENVHPLETRISDVRSFVQLLGFNKAARWEYDGQAVEEYYWFDETDYRSWSGGELAIYVDTQDGRLKVSTRSTISRSYYDLRHQNETIGAIRKRFGGTFRTDEGAGRYLRVSHGPPAPAASGCHLAFCRFGSNLIRAAHYLQSRRLGEGPLSKASGYRLLQSLDPEALSNNMIVSFLVSIVEYYLKSTVIALLKHSPHKERFLRGIRLQGEQLARIASGETSVEHVVAETLPFQRISTASRHFEAIDKTLDIGGVLRRPYRRRRTSFFDLLEQLVEKRHDFVHRAHLDLSVTTPYLVDIVYDLDVAMTRVYGSIAERYGWGWEKTWGVGRRPRRAAKRSVKRDDQEGA